MEIIKISGKRRLYTTSVIEKQSMENMSVIDVFVYLFSYIHSI